MQEKRRFKLQMNIIEDLGFKIDFQDMILDLGCGNGDLVREYRDNGYCAYGCDLNFKQGPNVDIMQKNGFLRLMDEHSYRIPFDDNTFRFVFSVQVFEHVQNYQSTLIEIKRVLKPGGISLHIFPSRYSLFEPHVGVPFGGIIQKKWWLLIWAFLGIKNQSQRGQLYREAANSNFNYLLQHTNYISKSKINEQVSEYFTSIIYSEKIFLKHSQRGRFVYHLSKVLPFLPSLYSTFRNRVLFYRKSSND